MKGLEAEIKETESLQENYRTSVQVHHRSNQQEVQAILIDL